MKNILSQLSKTIKAKPIEPREIFMSLPEKDKKYEYPRDVQTEVWKKWFDNRDRKNNIIKMNTGSGKTMVGLMILQSCLNEGKGPAVYVVPDSYLVNQVRKDAEKLGINTTIEQNDYDYSENKSILVINIQKLVNGRSIFGMKDNNNYRIGSIIMDDVHACLDTISNQCSINVPNTHPLYENIINLFKSEWKTYNDISYTNIIDFKDPKKEFLIPFWIWNNKVKEIYPILAKYNNDDKTNTNIFYNLPLIKDSLHLCNCILTSQSIEIMPKGIPITKIESFQNAKRRIFMSATLADDSVFISNLGLRPEEISEIITPEKADDIGDRLILFPKHLNNTITDEEIRSKVITYAKKYNVVVIVPSNEQATHWTTSKENIVDKDNIENKVAHLKSSTAGLTVFVNRYVGIDLPEDACRILVIDGLPPLHSLYNKYIQSIDPNGNLLLREQIQRIEQGMGRGVRSSNDSCCIILMGNKLADVLIRNDGIQYFSNATLEQYKLSKKLWDLLIKDTPYPTIDNIFDLLQFSLERSKEWIETSKECLSQVEYKTTPTFDEISLTLRKAYEYAMNTQYPQAAQELENAISKQDIEKTKGYLMQIKAEYTNFFDRVRAQEILLSARTFNNSVLMPIEGIHYQKLKVDKTQILAILEHKNKHNNNYIIYIDRVLSELDFTSKSNTFEKAFEDIGKILGFKSSRCDDFGGPDNLWAVGDLTYFVIECKNEATTDFISKDYCNQLSGSIRWFKKTYEDQFKVVPIMIHPSNVINIDATPEPNMRIMTVEKLQKFKLQIRNFCTALSQSDSSETHIKNLLGFYKLCFNDIIQEYTTNYKSKH